MYLRQRTMRLGRGMRVGVGRTDWILILIVALLTGIGLIAVANATIDPYAVSEGTGIFAVLSRLTTNSFYWQTAWVGVGLVAIFFIMLFDYRIYGELALYVFLAALALLGLVLLQDAGRGGVTAWFSWMGGSRSFQPSEVCKVAIIITLAKHVSRSGGPALWPMASRIATVRSSQEILHGIQTLQQSIAYAQSNVSVAAICGLLVWQLR